RKRLRPRRQSWDRRPPQFRRIAAISRRAETGGRTMFRPALAALALVSLAGAALAQDGDCYRLEKSGDAWVRMDTQTGEISRCEETSAQLVCRLAADERAAFEADLERLQD